MKILAIMGSPRKNGDSASLTKRIEFYLKNLGEIEFNYLYLADANLKQCQGCFNCVSKGEEFCPLKDDVSKIVDLLSNSDGIIFVSPVHALNVSVLMKNLLDRLAYNSHRPHFFNKIAIALTTTAGTGISNSLKVLTYPSLWGIHFVYQLGLMVHPSMDEAPRYAKQNEKKIKKAAKVFYNTIKKNLQTPVSLIKVIQFNILKANAENAPEYYSADYNFFHDKEYYYDIKIGSIKRNLGYFFKKMATNWMKKNLLHNK